MEAGLLVEAGEYDAGLAVSDEGYQLSAAINNWWNMAFTRIIIAPVLWDRGDPARALAMCRAVMDHARRGGFVIPLFVMPAYLADIFGDLGAVPAALSHLAEARAQQAPVAHMYQPLLRAVEIRVHLANGQAAEALALADAHADVLNANQTYYARGSMYYLLGLVSAVRCELALLRGEVDQVLAVTEQAEALAQRVAQRPMAEIRYWRARGQQAAGDSAAADATLQLARAQAEKIGQPRMLWRILALQAELAAQAGDSTQAAALLAQARGIIAAIADHAGSPELRASFLARPAVRAILP